MSGLFEALTRSSLENRLAGMIETVRGAANENITPQAVLDILSKKNPLSLSCSGQEYCRISACTPLLETLNCLAAFGLVKLHTAPSSTAGAVFAQWQITGFGKDVFDDYEQWRRELAASLAADAEMKGRLALYAGLFP